MSPPPEPRTLLRDALEHVRNGRPEIAEGLCRSVAARTPDEADAHHLLGLVALGRKETRAAEAALRRTVALAPQVARYHANLGTAQRAAGGPDAAERSCRRALRLDPASAETLYNRANLLADLDRFDEALAHYRMAVALQPGRDKLYYNLGNLMLRTHQPAAAIRAYETANTLAGGRFHDAAVNLGMAHQRLNALAEALRCYDEAIRIQPDNPNAHWNRSLVWLLSGRLAEGWREYEWRWRLPHSPPRALDRPLWTGEPPGGRTVLLHAEQGLGDTLQFVRYLPMVAARGARVVLECQRPLRRLLAASFPDATVVAAGDPLPEFDLHLPMLSLPRLFGTTLDSIPAAVPYLRPAPGAEAALPMAPRPGTLAAGLVWGGDPAHRNDRQRSLDAEALRRLLAISGVTFFTLQKGERARALDGLDAESGVVDCGPVLQDFADTAALVARLDLVITVDTSVAHLAGALGKPVFIMLPFAPDWRWFLERRDSPWYPTATLFRQRAPGDWSSVIERIAGHLRDTARPPTVPAPTQPSPT